MEEVLTHLLVLETRDYDECSHKIVGVVESDPTEFLERAREMVDRYNADVDRFYEELMADRSRWNEQNPRPQMEPTSRPRSFGSIMALLDGGGTAEEIPEAVAANREKLAAYGEALARAQDAERQKAAKAWEILEREHSWVFSVIAGSSRGKIDGELSIVTARKIKMP